MTTTSDSPTWECTFCKAALPTALVDMLREQGENPDLICCPDCLPDHLSELAAFMATEPGQA